MLLYRLYRYFIVLREIYQNVCPGVPGNPRDVIYFLTPKGTILHLRDSQEPRDKNVYVLYPKKQ